MLDYTVIAVSFMIMGGACLICKIILNSNESKSKVSKSKMHEMEEYIVFLKKQMQIYKNKASNMERGPELEGNIGDLGGLIPDFIGQFSEYAPKWLQPFLKNQDIQAALIQKVKDNPEKFSALFSKLIGQKNDKPQQTDDLFV